MAKLPCMAIIYGHVAMYGHNLWSYCHVWAYLISYMHEGPTCQGPGLTWPYMGIWHDHMTPYGYNLWQSMAMSGIMAVDPDWTLLGGILDSTRGQVSMKVSMAYHHHVLQRMHYTHIWSYGHGLYLYMGIWSCMHHMAYHHHVLRSLYDVGTGVRWVSDGCQMGVRWVSSPCPWQSPRCRHGTRWWCPSAGSYDHIWV